MSLLLIVGMVWMALAVPGAVLIGRAIRVADERHGASVPERLPAFAFEGDTLHFAR
jgi:hypothetical protein